MWNSKVIFLCYLFIYPISYYAEQTNKQTNKHLPVSWPMYNMERRKRNTNAVPIWWVELLRIVEKIPEYLPLCSRSKVSSHHGPRRHLKWDNQLWLLALPAIIHYITVLCLAKTCDVSGSVIAVRERVRVTNHRIPKRDGGEGCDVCQTATLRLCELISTPSASCVV